MIKIMKPGILWKQFLLYSLAFLIFMSIVILLAYSYIIDVSKENAAITQEQLTDAALEQVDSFLDHLMLIATQVAHDTEIVAVMEQLHTEENDPASNYFETNPDAQARIAEILSRHNEIKDPVYRIDVHNSAGDYICTDPTPELLQIGAAFTNSEGFQYFLQLAFVRDARKFIMMGPDPENIIPESVERGCIYMMMPIKNHDLTETYGYVEVYQSLESLFAQLDTNQETGIDTYLFYEMSGEPGGQIYPTDQIFPELEGSDYHMTQEQSYYDWFVIQLQDQSAFQDAYRPIIYYLLTAMAALLILLLVCVYVIAKRTNKPILALSERVKQVTLDKLPEHWISREASDEVKELEQSFDLMVQRLNTSFQLEKKAYLNALQAQMNPHFLYNCLSTIAGMSIPPHNEDIPKFCNHLAAILRYETAYEDKCVTLADELKNARDYLELMKLRHEEDFTYQVETDESLLRVPMPRLVLQPIIENCFEHGFRSVAPPWNIRIRVYREDRQWCIEVRDNGCGFDEEKRRQLLQQVDHLMEHLSESYTELKLGGLGLVNTILRLRLSTDNQLRYTITSNIPTGTVVTLKGNLHD